MFPFASHKQHGYRLSSLPLAYANLQEAGRIAREHNMRITVHPGQWTQLASPREVVVENAILELKYQCEMLDAMGIGTEGVMVIHMVRSVASSSSGFFVHAPDITLILFCDAGRSLR